MTTVEISARHVRRLPRNPWLRAVTPAVAPVAAGRGARGMAGLLLFAGQQQV